ncbi:hypothetical protein [Roseovarius pacificus]|uniref:hypothetical protein n=1 Tax=Roseovarius pacificus TaxID=337701 RepID=UPI002A188524|nr:hypothetical protein [Roseovarius pacificus]
MNTTAHSIFGMSPAMPTGTTGMQWLQQGKAHELTLGPEVLKQLEGILGFRPTPALACQFFRRATQVHGDARLLREFQPAHAKWARLGMPVWYFRFRVFGSVITAVIVQDVPAVTFTWMMACDAITQEGCTGEIPGDADPAGGTAPAPPAASRRTTDAAA